MRLQVLGTSSTYLLETALQPSQVSVPPLMPRHCLQAEHAAYICCYTEAQYLLYSAHVADSCCTSSVHCGKSDLCNMQAGGPYDVTLVNRQYHKGRSILNTPEIVRKLHAMPSVSSVK